MKPIEKKRIDYLDCARALCMLWIVGVWHMFEYIGQPTVDFMAGITYGTLATFVFVGGVFAGKENFDSTSLNRTLGKVRGYYRKRIIRIYPLMFIASVGFVITYGISWKTILTNFLGITLLLGDSPPTLWFVGMIIIFYAITPLMKITSNKVHWFIPSIVVFLCFYALTELIDSDTRLLMYFPFWCIGLSIGEGHTMEREKPSWINLLIFSPIFIILTCTYGNSREVTCGVNLIGFILMGAFIIVLLESCRVITKCT